MSTTIQEEKKESKESPKKEHVIEEIPVSLLAVATSVWFVRSLALIAGIIIGSLLLAYDFIFVNTYLIFGNTTSYFPWAWGALYTQFAIVQTMFLVTEAISLVAVAGCALSLLVTVPALREQLEWRK